MLYRLVGVSVTLVALLLWLPVAAWASPPAQAIATGAVISHSQTLIGTADGNQTFSAVDTLDFTGGITGTATDTYTFTVHPAGFITGHGTETCSSCTIGGRTGAYTEVFTFTAPADFATFQGHFTFVNASGDLNGLRGEGTFQGVDVIETVQLNYQFQP